MNGLSSSQPWEIRASELQAVARDIAQYFELWANGKPDHGLALFALTVEILVATREVLRARLHDKLPDPLDVGLQLVKCGGRISEDSRNQTEADYLLGLLLSNELMRTALDPLFRAWREARTAAVREASDAKRE